MEFVVGRRFRVRARIITFTVLALAIVILFIGGWAAATVLPGGGVLIAYGSALVAILTTALVLWRGTARLTEGLRALAFAHPEGVAFLARRLPPAVSDLPAFMRSKGFTDEIGDGWYLGLADYRGLTAWSPERRPRELLLMDWLEVGDVLAVRSSTVDNDSPGRVTVDVRPYIVPLTVEVGYAWGLVTMKLDAVDTADLVSAVIAHRP